MNIMVSSHFYHLHTQAYQELTFGLTWPFSLLAAAPENGVYWGNVVNNLNRNQVHELLSSGLLHVKYSLWVRFLLVGKSAYELQGRKYEMGVVHG